MQEISQITFRTPPVYAESDYCPLAFLMMISRCVRRGVSRLHVQPSVVKLICRYVICRRCC